MVWDWKLLIRLSLLPTEIPAWDGDDAVFAPLPEASKHFNFMAIEVTQASLEESFIKENGRIMENGTQPNVEAMMNSQELRKKVSDNRGKEQGDGLMARGLSTDHIEGGFLIRVAPIIFDPIGIGLPLITHLKVHSYRSSSNSLSSDIDYDTTKLWHMRLGHMSERIMDVLSKQDEEDHSTKENEESQEQ
ncbi:hypothetical protein RJ639_013851 [Escallonia herrerae]|uniref:GAG-pre-integrase domain-containing protein n=1 Tax=Escallonia herrerae TaxID=1293975 RepID=A0AA88VHF9_9ASTE|nr:hypothetical protein RJ639_013851 [Escallonia herrerae]